MRIKDLFSGTKKVMTPMGISKMGRLHDVEGLVEALDHVERHLRANVLDELIALSEKNRFDMMIQCGVIGKLMVIFKDGNWKERKRAALLLSSFILHKRMNHVLRHDWTIKAIISELPQADDALRRNLVYCVYELCRANMGHQVVYNNGINALVGAMTTDDPDIHYWSLYSLSMISSLGYQELILKTNLLPMLNRDLSSLDGEVHSLAEVLRDGLYNWKDKDSVSEDEPGFRDVNKQQGYEDLGVIDGYQRPRMEMERPRTIEGNTLTSVGEKVRDVKDDDVEMILDIDAEPSEAKHAIEFSNEDDSEDEFELEV
jgi:hypothetical protein